jgi:hypothetical protein
MRYPYEQLADRVRCGTAPPERLCGIRARQVPTERPVRESIHRHHRVLRPAHERRVLRPRHHGKSGRCSHRRPEEGSRARRRDRALRTELGGDETGLRHHRGGFHAVHAGTRPRPGGSRRPADRGRCDVHGLGRHVRCCDLQWRCLGDHRCRGRVPPRDSPPRLRQRGTGLEERELAPRAGRPAASQHPRDA